MVIPLRLVQGGEEQELLAQGWTKQTTIGEPRLSEIADSYRQLGYEVRIIEHPTHARRDTCNTCFTAGAEIGRSYGDLFIRKRSGSPPIDDELF